MNDPNNDTLKIIDRVGRRNQAAAEVALIAVTFVWGTTFVIVKDAIRTVPLHWFLFLRFALAAGALWFLAWFQSRRGHLPPLDHRGLFRAGASLGFLLFMGFEMQTLGLITTTATKSAFITGTVTLWVPVLGFVILRHRPNLWVAVAVPLGILGLFLLTIAPQNLSLGIHGWVFGDTQTLFCSLLFAGHLLLTKRSTHVYPTTPMTAVQLSVVAILSLIGSLSAGEEMSFNLSGAETAAILFLAIFATALAFWMQTKMQKFTTEDRAGVIFLFEPLFAALAAWVAMGEELRPAQWAGAILILTSAAIPMLRTLSLSRRSRPSN